MTSPIPPHLRSRSRLIDDVFQEGRPEACRDHEWHEGQQVMNVEDSGPRFAHWNPGGKLEVFLRGRVMGSVDKVR